MDQLFLKGVSWRYNGCVWIELIFAETENWNWKHCSEIIFKCVNSTVGPILNKKGTEKCNLWDREQCTNALFTVDKVNCCGWTKKKKKKKRKTQLKKRGRRNNLNPNGHNIIANEITFYNNVTQINNVMQFINELHDPSLVDWKGGLT